jgi:hypothetical protein
MVNTEVMGMCRRSQFLAVVPRAGCWPPCPGSNLVAAQTAPRALLPIALDRISGAPSPWPPLSIAQLLWRARLFWFSPVRTSSWIRPRDAFRCVRWGQCSVCHGCCADWGHGSGGAPRRAVRAPVPHRRRDDAPGILIGRIPVAQVRRRRGRSSVHDGLGWEILRQGADAWAPAPP